MKTSAINKSKLKIRIGELQLTPAQAAVACGVSVASIDKWCRASAGLINTKTGELYSLPSGGSLRAIELGLSVQDARALFPHHFKPFDKLSND